MKRTSLPPWVDMEHGSVVPPQSVGQCRQGLIGPRRTCSDGPRLNRAIRSLNVHIMPTSGVNSIVEGLAGILGEPLKACVACIKPVLSKIRQ